VCALRRTTFASDGGIPLRVNYLPHVLSSCAMDRAVRTNFVAFVNRQHGNTAPPNGAAQMNFMSGAQYAADVAARHDSTGSPRPSGPSFPAARSFLNPVCASLPAAMHGAASLEPNLYGVLPVASQAPPMTEPPPPGIATGALAAAPTGVAVAAGSCAPAPSGALSFLPSAVATASPSRVPGALSRAYDGVAPCPGLPDLRSFARRGPVDDADDDDADDVFFVEGDDNRTQCAGPGTSLPRPMAGSTSTLPINKKRRGTAGPSCAPVSPMPPRRGGPLGGGGGGSSGPSRSVGTGASGTMPRVTGAGTRQCGDGGDGRTSGVARDSGAPGSASPRTRTGFVGSSAATPPPRPDCTAAAAATAGRSAGGFSTASQFTELTRTVSAGFSGLRREVTAHRKELAIINCQMRAVTKKVDDVAVLADRLTASLFYQRRAVINMAGDVSTVLARTVVRSTREMPSGAVRLPERAADAEGNAVIDETKTMEAQVQEAQWILELKVCSDCSPTASCFACAGVPVLAPV